MLNRTLIDKEFNCLADVHYVNIASLAMPPQSVQQAYHGFMNDYISFHGADVKVRFKNTMKEARRNIAQLINAEPSEIGFVKNTSEGLGIIANGFSFQPGENVVTIDQEHAANKHVWIKLQDQGVELRVVKTRKHNIYIEDIVSAIDENTRAITIASVQYTSGIKSDLNSLGRICQDKGILFIVDGIQSIGRLKIDVKAMNIDYLACGGHKGLLSTYGVGFIYCKSDLLHKITPPYACHQSATEIVVAEKHQLKWNEDASKFEAGCLNYAGIAAINAGAKLINTLQIDQIEAYILALEAFLLNEIKDLPFGRRNPDDEKKRSGILCVEYPLMIKQQLKDIFRQHEVYATFRENYIRISIGFYNTEANMLVIAEALKEAAKLI